MSSLNKLFPLKIGSNPLEAANSNLYKNIGYSKNFLYSKGVR